MLVSPADAKLRLPEPSVFKNVSAEIDCGKVRARPVRIFGYSGLMGDGEEIELSEKSDNVWMYATAGTPNGVLLDVMCGGDE